MPVRAGRRGTFLLDCQSPMASNASAKPLGLHQCPTDNRKLCLRWVQLSSPENPLSQGQGRARFVGQHLQHGSPTWF